MRTIVCIKQVPDPGDFSKITLDPTTKTLNRTSIPVVINPSDKHAIEEALRIRERFGGKVVVVSMGPPLAEDALREALAIGADDAYLLCDKAFAGADTLATAYTLAAAIKKIGKFDLIFCGDETVDGGTGQVPPQIAEFLGIPHVSYVTRIEFVEKNVVRVERIIEHGHMIVETGLPALLAVSKRINEVRFVTAWRILKAIETRLTIWGLSDVSINEERVGLLGSPTQVSDCFMPKFERKKIILHGKPDKMSKELCERLHKLGMI